MKRKLCIFHMRDLIRNELFHEIEHHLLTDAKPSTFLNQAALESSFSRYPFHMLLKLKSADQQREHHPEGNVWNHTLLVVDEAAKRRGKSKNAKVLMWAALLHDIGKPDTTRIRKGKITSYDHDKVGAKLAIEFLSAFGLEESFIRVVSKLVRWHMQILFVLKNLPFADIETMKKETDINDIAILGLCDRLGRGEADTKKENNNIAKFLSIVNKS